MGAGLIGLRVAEGIALAALGAARSSGAKKGNAAGGTAQKASHFEKARTKPQGARRNELVIRA